MILGAKTGPTTFFSTNFPGVADDVDWKTTDLGAFNDANYLLTLPASTMSILVLQPSAVPEPATLGLIGAMFICLPRSRRQPV